MKSAVTIRIIGLLTIAIFTGYTAHAQVSPTVALPDKSASLDLTSAIKNGLLLPRVKLQSLTDSTTISTGHPAAGLLLYNTAPALTVTDSAGFYTWSGTRWLMFRGDNLGNHKAKQGLGMQNNSISNDGTNTKGLIFDDMGNATFRQQLIVKSLSAPIAGTENLVTVNTTGLLETATALGSPIAINNLPRKQTFTTPRIAPDDSSSVTANTMRTPTYMVVVTTMNGCLRTGIGVFMVSNNVISFMGGQARAGKYTATSVPGYNGGRLSLHGNIGTACQDSNWDYYQFDFIITVLPGNVISIINKASSSAQAYTIVVTET